MFKGTLEIQALLPRVMSTIQYGDIIPFFTAAEAYAPDGQDKPIKITFMVQPLAVNCMRKQKTKDKVLALFKFSEDTVQANSPGVLREAMLAAMEIQGAKCMIGRAPRGPLERVVQKHLKALQRQ